MVYAMKILSAADLPKKDRNGLKIHGAATIGKKWQIVIPKEVRTLIGLKEWDTLAVMTKKDLIIGLIKNDDVPTMIEYMEQWTLC